jgi:tellurite resistance protein TehA-like permease
MPPQSQLEVPQPNGWIKPNGRMSSSSDSTPHHRRYSSNSLGGQRGTPGTSRQRLHGDISIRNRLHHFTWAWFATTMSTGGIALVLSQTPHRFHGLTVIGEVFVILDIVLFLTFCTSIIIRFTLFSKAFLASLTHPTESLFFPTFWISTVNILSSITIYGIPKTGEWLVVTMRVLFWIYAACTFTVAVGQYFLLFTGKPLKIQSFTPAWILPVFPILLSGTLASLLGSSQPPQYALPILVAGVTFQGLGMLIATFFYGIYLGRLMTNGLPPAGNLPGMFIAVSTSINIMLSK